MTRLLFFGRLRDVAGYAERRLELPPSVQTIGDLRDHLAAQDSALGEALGARGVRVAIDRAFCLSDDASARGADEIAFMSPLSGG